MIHNLVKKIPLTVFTPYSQTYLEGEFFKFTIKYSSLEHTLETKHSKMSPVDVKYLHIFFF